VCLPAEGYDDDSPVPNLSAGGAAANLPCEPPIRCVAKLESTNPESDQQGENQIRLEVLWSASLDNFRQGLDDPPVQLGGAGHSICPVVHFGFTKHPNGFHAFDLRDR